MTDSKLDSHSDESVVTLLLESKDTRYFSVLYDRYADKVFAKCRSFAHTSAEAEDMAHDIFLKVFVKMNDFGFKSKFSTWLYSITYNFCIDYVRKNQTEQERQSEFANTLDEFEEEVDDSYLLQIQYELLKRVLNQINPEDKALLLMKYQDEMSIKEIMTATSMKESAIKMRLKRAKEKVITISKQYMI